MMSKKEYEKAARIVQRERITALERAILSSVFVEFFRDDNPRFDEARFRAACEPGANVRARTKRSA